MLPAQNENHPANEKPSFDKVTPAEMDLRIHDSFHYIQKSLERAKQARLSRRNKKSN